MKKVLTLILFGATLATCAVSVQALTVKPKSTLVCGGFCSVQPFTHCPRKCFCDLTLGDGVTFGVCAAS